MFRRIFKLAVSLLSVGLLAHADFSYITTQKTTGGQMAAMAGGAADRATKTYFKGRKMMTTSGDTATIMDFGAQTLTTVNNAQKTYSVKKFSDLTTSPAVKADMSVDVKDTGQKKMINGFSAGEMILTMNLDMDTGGRGGSPIQMRMEVDMWISSDVPGAGEVRAFYKQNTIPWAVVAPGNGNPSMQRAMAQLQRRFSELDGVPVEEVIRMKPAGGAGAPQMPQMSGAQQDQMQAAMAKLQEVAKQGGPQGAAAQQAMGRMGAMSGASAGAGSASGSGSMIEMTMDSSGFSTASIPDSVFAVSDGYKQVQ